MGPTWLASLEWMELGLVQLTLQWKRWDIELLSKYAAGQTWAKGFLNIVSFNVHWPKNHVRQRQQCFSKWTQRRLAIYRRSASCTDINKSDFFYPFPARWQSFQHRALQPGVDHLPRRRSSCHQRFLFKYFIFQYNQGSLFKSLEYSLIFVTKSIAQVENRPVGSGSLVAL